jgi:hypothetical protein
VVVIGQVGNDIRSGGDAMADVMNTFMTEDFSSLVTKASSRHPIVDESLYEDWTHLATLDRHNFYLYVVAKASGTNWEDNIHRSYTIGGFPTWAISRTPTKSELHRCPFLKWVFHAHDGDDRMYEDTIVGGIVTGRHLYETPSGYLDFPRMFRNYLDITESGTASPWSTGQYDYVFKLSLRDMVDELVLDASGFLSGLQEKQQDIMLDLGIHALDFFTEVLVKDFYIDVLLRMNAALLVGTARLVFGVPCYYIGKYLLDAFLPQLAAKDQKRLKEAYTEMGLSCGLEGVPPTEEMLNLINTFTAVVPIEGLTAAIGDTAGIEGFISTFIQEVLKEGDSSA